MFGRFLVLFASLPRDQAKLASTYTDTINALVLLVALSVLLQPKWLQSFQYHGQTRWQGLWLDPNHFGALTSTGLVLAIGQALRAPRRHPQIPKRYRPRTQMLAYLLCASLLSVGLIQSYSRGAWISTTLALAYLGYKFSQAQIQANADSIQRARFYQALSSNLVSCLIILFCLATISVWGSRNSKNLIFHRAASVVNVNDFSWRNRLAAYEGALQIMVIKPWIGLGWGNPKVIYDQLYRGDNPSQANAIELNDYFMVGMTLGLPALACFVGYILLSLPDKPDRKELSEIEHSLDWSRTISRAGFLVLLTGFWFDSGLFSLSLAIPFGVFLELGTDPDSPSFCHTLQKKKTL